jgi:hypothetical protein
MGEVPLGHGGKTGNVGILVERRLACFCAKRNRIDADAFETGDCRPKPFKMFAEGSNTWTSASGPHLFGGQRPFTDVGADIEKHRGLVVTPACERAAATAFISPDLATIPPWPRPADFISRRASESARPGGIKAAMTLSMADMSGWISHS